jgi:hypothetical protein
LGGPLFVGHAFVGCIESYVFVSLSSPPTLSRETLSISIPFGSFLLSPCFCLTPLLTAIIRRSHIKIRDSGHMGCRRCIWGGGWAVSYRTIFQGQRLPIDHQRQRDRKYRRSSSEPPCGYERPSSPQAVSRPRKRWRKGRGRPAGGRPPRSPVPFREFSLSPDLVQAFR